mgnify:CR=1 FL=1
MSTTQIQAIKTSKHINFIKLCALLLTVSWAGFACDDSDDEDNTDEMMAGEVTAGEMMAGEVTAGEMMAGEMPAGEMPAGEMPAGEMPAGEMMFDGSYSPDAPMSSLNDEGQQAFCESFVARNEAAEEMTSDSDRQTFREKSCLLAGLFGGATDEATCEATRMQCMMDLENATFTVESCMSDFADAFMSCGATVSEIEGCETATRTQLLSAILGLNTGMFSCGNVGDPTAFILAAGLPTEAPAECTIPSVAMCQDQ